MKEVRRRLTVRLVITQIYAFARIIFRLLVAGEHPFQ